MARNIKQIRFYQDGSSKNSPNDANLKNKIITGTVFDNYNPIKQLGIQTLPGTKFYVNNAPDPVIVGKTGIFELDIDEETSITKLTFNQSSIQTINDNPSAYLIVDLIWGVGEES